MSDAEFLAVSIRVGTDNANFWLDQAAEAERFGDAHSAAYCLTLALHHDWIAVQCVAELRAS